jgi:hypothetical protein
LILILIAMRRNLLVVTIILFFSVIATYHTIQRNGFFFFEKEKFYEYQSGWGNQYERHLRILEGNSYFYNPWQYRILSAYMAESFIQLFRHSGIKYEYFWGFFTFRTLLNLILFMLLYRYTASISNNPYLNLLFISISFYFLIHSDFDSDLNFNTIIDVILYLLTLYILQTNKKISWIIVLTILGALNRETSIFIPFILLIWNLSFSYEAGILQISEKRQHTFTLFLINFVLFSAIFISLRLIYGYRSPLIEPSLDLFWVNLKFIGDITELNDKNAYYQTFTAGIFIVFIVGSGMFKLNKEKRVIFFSIVPTWIILHLFLGRLVEARLLLVPIVSICMPFLAEIIAKYNNNLTVPVTSNSV